MAEDGAVIGLSVGLAAPSVSSDLGRRQAWAAAPIHAERRIGAATCVEESIGPLLARWRQRLWGNRCSDRTGSRTGDGARLCGHSAGLLACLLDRCASFLAGLRNSARGRHLRGLHRARLQPCKDPADTHKFLDFLRSASRRCEATYTFFRRVQQLGRRFRKELNGSAQRELFRLHVPLTHASSTKHLPRAPQEAVTRSLSSIITINSNARTRPYSGPRSPHSSHTLTAILSHASAPALAHVHEEETRRRRAARARGQIRRGARSRPRSSPGARRPSAAACCHHTACTMPMRLCVR